MLRVVRHFQPARRTLCDQQLLAPAIVSHDEKHLSRAWRLSWACHVWTEAADSCVRKISPALEQPCSLCDTQFRRRGLLTWGCWASVDGWKMPAKRQPIPKGRCETRETCVDFSSTTSVTCRGMAMASSMAAVECVWMQLRQPVAALHIHFGGTWS
ncbi:uncharacterized protein B0I36DRAFT_314765 [Microdochium trichocladiopsis]|uniref:Uncharacterized protein n=1 Tax=Microdochium trichocladiopsis TaxID=1682393 RepID=A0A9P9BSC5_9PEZI|nr:uncharacterized protein B0I36DRAFT_314765 [Microdochium trichocladiopsis]KAH7037765.1 hypothetical protein B0I36DRAFT_314765 [Microdochium trichocladiopsis]